MAGDDRVNIEVRLDSSSVPPAAAQLNNTLAGIARNAQESSAKAAAGVSQIAGSFGQLRNVFASGTSGIQGFAAAIAGTSGSLLPLTAAVAGAGLAFAGLNKAISAAAESQDTIIRLASAVERTGDASEGATKSIEGAVQALFKVTAFDDEPLRKAATAFVTITGNAHAAADALGPIADLSVALGIDLDQSARLVAKATEGMTTQLQRAGIVFTDTERKMLAASTEGDRLAIVLAKIQDKVGGAATAELGTYAGQVSNFKKQWDELAEALGTHVLPILTSIIETLGMIPAALAKAVPAGGTGQGNFFVRGLTNAARGIKNDIAIAAGQPTAEDIQSDSQAFEAFGKTLGSKFIAGLLSETTSGGVFGDAITAGLADVNASLDQLAKSEAFSKMAPDIERARQRLESMDRDLKQFKADTEFKLRPPDLDPVAAAVQQVHDKIAAITREADDASQKFADDAKVQTANIIALNILLSEQKRKQVVDLGAIVSLTEKIREAEALLAKDDSMVKGYKAARTEAESLGSTLERIAKDNALAEMAAKVAEEFRKLQVEIDQVAARAKETIQNLTLPSGLADSLNEQIDQAKKEAQNLAIASLFFDPSVKTELQKAAQDFQKAHADGLTAGAKVLGDRLHKAAQELADAIDKFASDMADVFTAGVTGGAEGFAKAASKLFLQGVNDGAKQIFKSLATLAFGGKPDPNAPEFQGPGGGDKYLKAVEESDKQSKAIMSALTVAVGAVGQSLQIFQQAKQGQAPSVPATALSFAVAGATFGYIGAIVGAVVGAVIGIVAQAKAKAASAYGLYGIEGGQPYVKPMPGFEKQFANITAQQMNDMLSQMQHTLEGTQNDYIKLLRRFPDSIKDFVDVTAANFAPTMDTWKKTGLSFMDMIKTGAFGFLYNPGGTGGGLLDSPFQKGVPVRAGDTSNPALPNPNVEWKKAFAQFASDFQNWVNNTLPKEIAASFEEPLAAGFETLGLSAKRFKEIWDRLQSIDPKDAIKSLNDLFDALTAFGKSMKFLSNDIYGGKGFVFGGGLIEQARAANVQSFADKLAQADVGLVQLGATIEQLVGPEQITQAKEWGDALMQREEAVKQFFQQVAQAIDNVIAGYQAKIRDLTLAGFKKPDGTPDVAAQVGYLKKYADTLWGQITQATTPEQVMQLSNELSNTISKIQQIGGAQSVEAAEAYRVWAIQQLQKAQDLVVAQLNKMAMDVAQQNQNFLDAIQGFIDAFLGATERLTGDSNQDQPTAEIPPPPERHNEGPHRWIIKGQEDLFSLTGEDTYTPPQPGAAQSLYEPPEANQSRELMTMVVAGTQENVVYLKRIAMNQEQILAVLAEGRDIRVDVGGELEIIANGAPTGDTVALDDGGFDRREVGSRGKRAT